MTNNLLSELKYDEFKELILFLKRDDTLAYPILRRVNRFLPELNAEQAIVLSGIITSIIEGNDAENEYNSFIEMYGNLKLDPSGRSTPNKIDFTSISLLGLELSYNKAVEVLKSGETGRRRIAKQIVNAKTLTPLINMTKYYKAKKLLYYKKEGPYAISRVAIEHMEKQLMELVGRNNVCSKLLTYIDGKEEKSIKYFIEHFQTRLNSCYSDRKNFLNPLNKEFLENLKKVQ